MKKRTYLMIFSFLATALFSNTFAQKANVNSGNNTSRTKFNTYWYLSLDGGATTLIGDNTYQFLDKQFNGRLSAGYFFKPYFGTDLRVGFGKLIGTHSLSDISKTTYADLSANAIFEPLNIIFGYDPSRIITLQLHLGVGQVYTDVTINTDGVLLEIPAGAMAGIALTDYLYLYVDYTYSWVDSGHLDSHNTDYSKDRFSTFNIGLNLKFEKLLSYTNKFQPTLYQNW